MHDNEYSALDNDELIGQISHLAGLVERREFGQRPEAEWEVRAMLAEAEADSRGL